jgi:hypothetical protein
LPGSTSPSPIFAGLLVENRFPETITVRPDQARGKSNNDFYALVDFARQG